MTLAQERASSAAFMVFSARFPIGTKPWPDVATRIQSSQDRRQ